MYYAKNPFLKVGLPFLTAIVFGTLFLVDLRKSRYETQRNVRFLEGEGPLAAGEGKQRKKMKTLEEELKEWEEKHRRKIEEARGDYEMKPVWTK